MRAVLTVGLLVSTVAFGQTDTAAEVRAAFEDQLPLPARPLSLPAPAAKPSAPGMKVRETARLNGRALGREDRDAIGQARAAEVRKNAKKPHPPKP